MRLYLLTCFIIQYCIASWKLAPIKVKLPMIPFVMYIMAACISLFIFFTEASTAVVVLLAPSGFAVVIVRP